MGSSSGGSGGSASVSIDANYDEFFNDNWTNIQQDWITRQQQSQVFDWQQQLLYPGIVTAAQWGLQQLQNSDRDGIFKDMRDLSGEAVARYKTCAETALQNWADNAPTTPQAAEYIPIDCCEVYRDTILCNVGLEKEAEALITEISMFHTLKSLERINLLDPKYTDKNSFISCSILELARGEIPVSDLMEGSTDSCERSAQIGGLGGACNMRRQDLGVSRLRAQREAFEREVALRQSYNRDISPLSLQGDIRSMLKDPALAVNLAQKQAELNQQSLQNKYNLESIPDPTIADRTVAAMASCTICLQSELNAALLQNLNTVDYQSIAQPFINGVASGITSAFGNQVDRQVQQTPVFQQSSFNNYGPTVDILSGK